MPPDPILGGGEAGAGGGGMVGTEGQNSGVRLLTSSLQIPRHPSSGLVPAGPGDQAPPQVLGTPWLRPHLRI